MGQGAGGREHLKGKRGGGGGTTVLTAPQEPQVLDPLEMEELHLGQVLWALTGCIVMDVFFAS